MGDRGGEGCKWCRTSSLDRGQGSEINICVNDDMGGWEGDISLHLEDVDSSHRNVRSQLCCQGFTFKLDCRMVCI